ncbi:MAG: 23S rRNA (pseudouridine(1915)-N(3))-methyltransferase RlmH [Clostridiales bacterium]|nr:23S rRNA (pseudouridine(1915)-N(3))-methyltransferase RlmH [Bacillota bacterium]NLL53732.1 23S rRNA (pseudouridine(1915)-N(3))-methyltransferase RlmH [Clostridiales bacterium]
MHVCVLCVGKLKEEWQRSACREYLKRLSRYGRFAVVEVPDQSEPLNASDAQRRQVMDREGEALLKQIRPGDWVAALCIRGEAPDSHGLAKKMGQWEQAGRRVVLVIGGSLGLSDAVLARADQRLSFSRLTFPHALMRVILLEQLYRSCKINAGERYHK